MRILQNLTSCRVAYLQRGIFRQAAFGAGVICGVVGVLALASSWTSVRILAPGSPDLLSMSPPRAVRLRPSSASFRFRALTETCLVTGPGAELSRSSLC